MKEDIARIEEERGGEKGGREGKGRQEGEAGEGRWKGRGKERRGEAEEGARRGMKCMVGTHIYSAQNLHLCLQVSYIPTSLQLGTQHCTNDGISGQSCLQWLRLKPLVQNV